MITESPVHSLAHIQHWSEEISSCRKCSSRENRNEKKDVTDCSLCQKPFKHCLDISFSLPNPNAITSQLLMRKWGSNLGNGLKKFIVRGELTQACFSSFFFLSIFLSFVFLSFIYLLIRYACSLEWSHIWYGTKVDCERLSLCFSLPNAEIVGMAIIYPVYAALVTEPNTWSKLSKH